jgi:nucleoside-diphosphate-sugar epimerase
MKVCVLGASGFIGKNLVQGMDRWIGVTRSELDLMDQQAVEEYFKTHTYDVVIHCVASINQTSETTAYKNILMFENVVRVFKGKLLYFSSGAALRGNPPTDPYGLSKWIIDRRIETIQTLTLSVFGDVTDPVNFQQDLVLCVKGKDMLLLRGTGTLILWTLSM